MPDTGHTVHLPWGYVPSSRQRVRAFCSCGWGTTPRADRGRALDALITEHGYTAPVCALCDTDFLAEGHSWDDIRNRDLEILLDGSNQFLACKGAPRRCRDGAAQKQLHLDQAVAQSFGITMPRPRLRLSSEEPTP
jgi:hypothetical protein